MRHHLPSERWWQRVDPAGVLGYLLAREKPGGGFSQTPLLPATVEDTYYCLRSLELLGAPGRARRLGGYLEAVPVSATSPAKILFQQAYLRRRAASPLEGLEEALATRLSRQPAQAELYYGLRAARQMRGKAGARLEAAVRLAARGRALRWRTPADLRQVLVLGEFFGLAPPRDSTGWLLACQNLDGGFGFLPGTTSFLENTYHALRALAQLGERPRRPEECGQFVLRCQGGGGFGRTSSTVLSPETTCMGLASLGLLDAPQAAGQLRMFLGGAKEPAVEEALWRPMLG